MIFDPMIAALWVARLVQFAAVIVMLGGASFRLYAAKGLGRAPAVQQAFDRWLWRVLMYAAFLSLLSSVIWLFVQSAIMGESWASALTAETLSAVLLQTEFGHLWIGRLVIAVALVAAMLFPYERKSVIAGPRLWAGLSILLVASLAGTGHAVMASGAGRIADVTIQAVHLIAAAIWLGGLLPLGYVLGKARKTQDPIWLAAAQAVLPRYSLAGLLAVVSLVLTGLAVSWSLVGTVRALFHTAYGQLLLAKFGIFLLMVGLAVVNRLNLTPKIMAARWRTNGSVAPLTVLWRNVAWEQGFGVIILVMVSILGTLRPGNNVDDQGSAMIDHSPTLGAIHRSITSVFPREIAALDRAAYAPLSGGGHAS